MKNMGKINIANENPVEINGRHNLDKHALLLYHLI